MLIAIGPAMAAERRLSAYGEALYGYSVAEQCGLLTGRAEQGFAAEERRLARAEQLDADGVMKARIAAGVAFASEYQNRGLGGARGWCRTEGAEAVRRFEAAPVE
ncbi:MAG: hypothetical protein IT562_25175 [Alphaproteobacteria bacterium]|nr:hypothetical protein [Alphaproteobacteria bacterium]